MEIDGRALLDRVTGAMEGRDPQRVTRLVTHDVHYEDPFGPAPHLGPDELVERLRVVWEAVPNLQVEGTGPCLHDGDRIVALPLRAFGNHRGALPSIPATQRFVNVHGVLVCELDASAHRLHRIRLFCDRYGASVQLGVLPEEGTVGDRALRALQGFGLLRRR